MTFKPACRHCRDFHNDAAYFERAFAGLTAMGSGYSSVRAEDGICERHGRHLPASASCADFAAREHVEAGP